MKMNEKYNDCIEEVSYLLFNAIIQRETNLKKKSMNLIEIYFHY
uniref:Uncharacterized protein n=1 Tax=Gloeothece verrucosa (strain PCC 7822) TaxID=497965 RepID=E0UN05_GLOV7|nr:hypothetical protein Cyan7822_6576 [Gloeothece verrucosa PCC 7822]